jgi:tetratricopeptide (TPR) repeat protein
MLIHQAFYDVLADSSEDLPNWAPTLAGLAVLNLVEAAREDASVVDADWTGVRVAADAVSALREGSAFRRPLLKIMEDLRDIGPSMKGLNQSLFQYGRTLDLEGHWTLAADVFSTVTEMAREARDANLAIEATTALGGAARRSGDWDTSAESYATAAHLADSLGDTASGLTIRVGTANTHMARGNLPAAQLILDEVIEESGKSGLTGVQALAYHGRASVAHLKRNFAETVTLAYMALERTSNPSARDSIMADIAAAFAELGMRKAARDAHMVISLTSRYQWVRWQAGINLMELAAIDGMEGAFDSYARDLRNAALDPRLRSYYLLYFGEGALGFGRIEVGIRSLEECLEFAARSKINQVAHEAGQALERARLGAGRIVRIESRTEWVSKDLAEIAEAIGDLRESALVTSAGAGWSRPDDGY